MSAISSLMCSDLLALDQIFAGTRQQLQQLSQGSPGPVANRATKVTPGTSPRLLPRWWCSLGFVTLSLGHPLLPTLGVGSVHNGWAVIMSQDCTAAPRARRPFCPEGGCRH